MKDREFATVARFASMEQAQVVKAMLDSMGVDKQLMKAKFDRESFKTAWKEK